MIIRMEKSPASEINTLGERATPDNKSRVARQPPLRPDLAPIAAPPTRLPRRLPARQGGCDLWESTAPFPAVPPASLFKVAAQAQQVVGMGMRDIFQIKELDGVCGGVVLAGDKIGVLGNDEAVFRERLAHLRLVGHDRQDPRIWLARVAAAGAAGG